MINISSVTAEHEGSIISMDIWPERKILVTAG